MMKFILIFCISILSTSLFAQKKEVIKTSYSATYEFTYIQDTVEKKYSRPIGFLLAHANGESRFHEVNKQFNDSMLYLYEEAFPQKPKTQAEVQEQVDQFMASSKAWRKSVYVSYKIQKDFSRNVFRNVLAFAFPPQHMEESLYLSWETGDLQDTIMGLNCQVAYTTYGGRKYTAWFAPDIPIYDGPYVFNGLPGLIVKVSDEKEWFTFRLKTVTASPEERYWREQYINPTSKVISREIYVKQSADYKNNPRMIGILDMSEEELLRKKEQYRNKYYLLLEAE